MSNADHANRRRWLTAVVAIALLQLSGPILRANAQVLPDWQPQAGLLPTDDFDDAQKADKIGNVLMITGLALASAAVVITVIKKSNKKEKREGETAAPDSVAGQSSQLERWWRDQGSPNLQERLIHAQQQLPVHFFAGLAHSRAVTQQRTALDLSRGFSAGMSVRF